MAYSLVLHGALVLAFSFFKLASGYSIVDTVVGPDFYNFFAWEAIPDPTHGRVWVRSLPHSFSLFSTFCRNYVDQGTSRNLGLTSASSDSFILRADSTSVLDPSGPGRNSVRIKSKNTYTQHLVVYVSWRDSQALFPSWRLVDSWVYRFDVRHMPEGCGWVYYLTTPIRFTEKCTVELQYLACHLASWKTLALWREFFSHFPLASMWTWILVSKGRGWHRRGS